VIVVFIRASVIIFFIEANHTKLKLIGSESIISYIYS
jgi:hypothetical protein